MTRDTDDVDSELQAYRAVVYQRGGEQLLDPNVVGIYDNRSGAVHSAYETAQARYDPAELKIRLPGDVEAEKMSESDRMAEGSIGWYEPGEPGNVIAEPVNAETRVLPLEEITLFPSLVYHRTEDLIVLVDATKMHEYGDWVYSYVVPGENDGGVLTDTRIEVELLVQGSEDVEAALDG
jgi:hypothetical protein